MSNVVIKYRRKPTPIKTAILWISLTTNCFLALMGYFVIEGKIEKAPINYVDTLIQAEPAKPVKIARK